MTYQERMFENIYDIIKVCSLSNKQDDDWAELSRKHADEAKKEMHRFIKDKELEWSPEDNTISLGKRFKIKLLTN